MISTQCFKMTTSDTFCYSSHKLKRDFNICHICLVRQASHLDKLTGNIFWGIETNNKMQKYTSIAVS